MDVFQRIAPVAAETAVIEPRNEQAGVAGDERGERLFTR